MKAKSSVTFPLARTNEIVTKEVDGELLIYDCARDEAHCLNSSAAAIWKLCDGRTSIPEMAQAVRSAAGQSVDEILIHATLRQLSARALLENCDHLLDKPFDISRRALARRLGVAVALLPIITTISVPTALAAVSCAGPCSGAPGRGSCPSGCLCSAITSRCVVA